MRIVQNTSVGANTVREIQQVGQGVHITPVGRTGIQMWTIPRMCTTLVSQMAHNGHRRCVQQAQCTNHRIIILYKDE